MVCVRGFVCEEVGCLRRLVDLQVLCQGSCRVRVSVLRCPIDVLPVAACSLGPGEMQYHYPETVLVLVVGEVLFGDKAGGTEAVQGPHHELAESHRCIKASGQAGENHHVQWPVKVELALDCQKERWGERAPLLPP